MKASEYIAKLQALIAAHGDLRCVSDCDFGLQVADEPQIQTLDIHDHAIVEGGPCVLGESVIVIG